MLSCHQGPRAFLEQGMSPGASIPEFQRSWNTNSAPTQPNPPRCCQTRETPIDLQQGWDLFQHFVGFWRKFRGKATNVSERGLICAGRSESTEHTQDNTGHEWGWRIREGTAQGTRDGVEAWAMKLRQMRGKLWCCEGKLNPSQVQNNENIALFRWNPGSCPSARSSVCANLGNLSHLQTSSVLSNPFSGRFRKYYHDFQRFIPQRWCQFPSCQSSATPRPCRLC